MNIFRKLFIGGLFTFLFIISGLIFFQNGFADQSCGIDNANRNDPNNTCYTTCSDEDIENFVPGCFAKFDEITKRDNEVDSRINEKDLRTQILKLVNYFLSFLGLLAVVSIVYAGIIMVADFGSEENVGKSKKILLWAGVGIIVILVSYSFVNWVIKAGDKVKEKNTTEQNQNNTDEKNDGKDDENTDSNNDDKETEDDSSSGDDYDIGGNQDITKGIDSLIGNYGKMDNNTSKLLDNTAKGYLNNNKLDEIYKSLPPEKREGFKKYNQLTPEEKSELEESLLEIYPEEYVEDIVNYLEKGDRLTEKNKQTIQKALRKQGYPEEKIITIMKKIESGEPLTEEEVEMVKSALKYGAFLEKLETELAILYESMPQTAVNVAAYNDVITAFTEVKQDPTNEEKILILKKAFIEFVKVIKNTPRMTAHISVKPNKGEAPLIVTLDGSDSSDPNNQTIPKSNYQWSYFDLDGISKIIGTGPIVEYNFEEPGLYVVDLTVETNLKKNGYKTAMDGKARVKIKVEPKSSILQVYVNGKQVESVKKIHISQAKKGVIFDASKSAPRVGRKILEYKWYFGDGAEDYSETGEPITHQYDKVGNYMVKLEAKDNTGKTNIKSFRVIVEHLTADIEIYPEQGTVRTMFQLSAAKSLSSDSLIQSFGWEIREPEGKIVLEADKERINFQPETAGKYQIKLTVSDSEGISTSDVFSLNIRSLLPTASYIVERKSRAFPSIVIFNGSSSSDPDREILKYSWDFDGDGVFDVKNANENTVEYSFPVKGSYHTILEVKDPYGEKDTFSRIVEINSILDVDFEMSAIAIQKDNDLELTPVSSRATAFYWDFGDGTKESHGNEAVIHKYTNAGVYIISLNVFDNENNETKTQKRVYVGDGEHPVAAFEVNIDGKKVFPEFGPCKGNALSIVTNRRNTIKFLGDPSINIDGTQHMLDFTWDFGDGEFGNTKVSGHRYMEVTDNDKCYEVNLSVKDRISGKLNEVGDLFIKVENLKPTFQKLIVDTDEDNEKITPYEIRLKAQGAIDPDGNIKNYRWWYRRKDQSKEEKKGLVQTQTAYANLTIVSDGVSGLENEYVFIVELTDNEDQSVSSEEIFGESTSVIVKNGNVEAPSVDFTMDKNQVYVGDTISFFANIKDPQEKTLENIQYEWDFNGDGIFDDLSNGNQVARRYDTPGEYSVRLRIKYQGLATSASHTVFVDKVTRFPLAAFTNQIKGYDFYGDASVSKYDPALEDKTLRFNWDFNKFVDADGDGDSSNDSESNEMKAHYTYSKSGTYYVSLVVVDMYGNEDKVEQKIVIVDSEKMPKETKFPGKNTIQIKSKSSPITTLDISIDQKVVAIGETVTITARVINADGSPYNEEVDFSIIKGEAILAQDLVIAENGSANTDIIPKQIGEIIIRVIAKNTYFGSLEEKISLQTKEKISPSVITPELTTSEVNVREVRKNNTK